eukprot:6578870-Prymnesium_polylepis.1
MDALAAGCAGDGTPRRRWYAAWAGLTRWPSRAVIPPSPRPRHSASSAVGRLRFAQSQTSSSADQLPGAPPAVLRGFPEGGGAPAARRSSCRTLLWDSEPRPSMPKSFCWPESVRRSFEEPAGRMQAVHVSRMMRA